jgi:hypothetical protein
MKIGKIADLIKESYVSEESGGIVTAKVRKLKKSFHPADGCRSSLFIRP